MDSLFHDFDYIKALGYKATRTSRSIFQIVETTEIGPYLIILYGSTDPSNVHLFESPARHFSCMLHSSIILHQQVVLERNAIGHLCRVELCILELHKLKVHIKLGFRWLYVNVHIQCTQYTI